jgi:hypothetical protein
MCACVRAPSGISPSIHFPDELSYAARTRELNSLSVYNDNNAGKEKKEDLPKREKKDKAIHCRYGLLVVVLVPVWLATIAAGGGPGGGAKSPGGGCPSVGRRVGMVCHCDGSTLLDPSGG